MRPTRPLWLLIALGSLCLPSAPAQAQSVHDARGEALRLNAAGRYQEALPLFDKVLARKPRDLDSLNKRACIYLRWNQPQRALADLDVACRDHPFLAYDAMQLNRQFYPDVSFNRTPQVYALSQLYPSAFTNRGIAHLMLSQDEAALADFRMSIAIRRSQLPVPSDSIGLAAAYCGIAQYHHRKGNQAEALEAYNQALGYNPNDPNIHLGRGVTYSAVGQFADALADHDAALRLDPNNARAHALRASVLDLLDRDKEALEAYAASIRLDPNVPNTRRLRGALLSRLGRQTDAIPDFDAALKLDPTDSAALKDRGGVQNRLGNIDQALLDLDQAIKLNPKNARAYQNRAATFNTMALYNRAIEDCDQALRLEPGNAGALNNRGVAFNALGHPGRAVADLSESLEIDPSQVPAYVNRGGAFARLGLLDQAAADFQRALELAPRLALAESGLAKVEDLRRSHAHSGSAADDPSVLQLPSESRRHLELGNTRRAAGDWPGAIAEFTQALDLDPQNADALASRGWSRACAALPDADADARAWLNLKTWRDPFAPYMALLGILSSSRPDQQKQAVAFLDEALANTSPPAWPAPIFRYLKRTSTSAALLAAAPSIEAQSEAHAVIALDLLRRGEPTAAADHLRWVRDHGITPSIASDLAREALKRLSP